MPKAGLLVLNSVGVASLGIHRLDRGEVVPLGLVGAERVGKLGEKHSSFRCVVLTLINGPLRFHCATSPIVGT